MPSLLTQNIKALTTHRGENYNCAVSCNQKISRQIIPLLARYHKLFVLVDETRDGVNTKLELWSQILESRSFRLSRTKTKYLECKFSKQGIRDYSIVILDGQEIPMSSHFKFLGSII